MANNQSAVAQDSPCSSISYSLELFEGEQFSDLVVGLDQKVRAAVLEMTSVDLTIETDKDSYTLGDTITISGAVLNAPEGQIVFIRVFSPDGSLARADVVSVSTDGTYTYSFPSGGPLMSIAGQYMAEASCGNVGVGTFFMFELADEAATVSQTSNSQEDTVTFRWINPGGDVASETTVPFSSPREDTFAPDEPGDWTVQAEIARGATVQTISSPLSVEFFVLPESPVGAIAIVATSLAVAGIFAMRNRRDTKV